MVVHPERMRANLNATHGALYSQRALLALVECGALARRRLPDRPGERPARWDEGVEFRDLLAEAAPGLDLDAVFDPSAFVRHAEEIVARLDAL